MMGLDIREIPFVAYPVTDVARAREFYEGVLGLQTGDVHVDMPDMPGKCWIEYDIGGQTLAISNLWDPAVDGGPVAAFEVEDFEAAVAHFKAHQVKILNECLESQVCRLANIEDPDGNWITIHKRKPIV